jgi:hypothetical protein
MTRARLVPLAIALLALLPFVVGAKDCHCSTAKITGATLARGYDEASGKAIDPTTTFKPDTQKVHLVVTTQYVPSDTKVGAEWWVVDAGGVKDHKLDGIELKLDSTATAHFSLSSPTAGWPPGKYKVIVSLDGKPNQTLEFEVTP